MRCKLSLPSIKGGRGSLTIDDLCLSDIAPSLMEKKIGDDLIGDKIQINKQTSDEWRLVSELNPNSVSAGIRLFLLYLPS
jgi:hypothetical protein